MTNIVSLSLASQPLGNLHFDNMELVREQLDTIGAALAVGYSILDRAAEIGDAPALRVVKDLFAGLAYQLDELAYQV